MYHAIKIKVYLNIKALLSSENHTGQVENFVQPEWESNLQPQEC